MIDVVREPIRQFVRRGLLTSATAIAYNALWSLPPLALLLLAIAGESGVRSTWTEQVGPPIRRRLTEPTWHAVDDTVLRLLDRPHPVWIVVGLVIATWEMSGLVRAVGDGLNSIFERKETRSFRRRYAITTAVALPVTLLALVPFFAVLGGKLLHPGGVLAVLLFVARWSIALVALFALLALVIRVAPSTHPPLRPISVGAGLVIVGWVGVTLVFGVYVSYVADFRSAYGNLITVMVLMAYLYTLSIVFLGGVLLDTIGAQRAQG